MAPHNELNDALAAMALAEPAPRNPNSAGIISDATTIYMPIVSPPTPAPSPRPLLKTNDDAVNWARIAFAHLRMLGASARHQFLDAILTDCSPSELLFIHSKVTPLLKRDFLKDLPFELAVTILTFVDDPKTLARACRVSRSWNTIICEEDSVWKHMREVCDVGDERIYPNTEPHVPFSDRRYLMDYYRTCEFHRFSEVIMH